MSKSPTPPQDRSTWSFAVSLVLTGSALATHPLWLPNLQDAWYGRQLHNTASGCTHLHTPTASTSTPLWAPPLRQIPSLPVRPELSPLQIPKVIGPPSIHTSQASLAFALPTPRFERPAFEYGLPGHR